MQSAHKLLLAGLVLVVVGPFNVIRAWTAHNEETEIARDGVRAEGHVTRKWIHQKTDSPAKDYMVDYVFDLPSGQSIEGQDEIGFTLYDEIRKGDPIGVLYARENPRANFTEAAGPASRSGAVFSTWMGTLFTLVGLGIIGRHWLGSGPSRSTRRRA